MTYLVIRHLCNIFHVWEHICAWIRKTLWNIQFRETEPTSDLSCFFEWNVRQIHCNNLCVCVCWECVGQRNRVWRDRKLKMCSCASDIYALLFRFHISLGKYSAFKPFFWYTRELCMKHDNVLFSLSLSPTVSFTIKTITTLNEKLNWCH